MIKYMGYKCWRENGQLFMENTCVNGKKHGL